MDMGLVEAVDRAAECQATSTLAGLGVPTSGRLRRSHKDTTEEAGLGQRPEVKN